MFGGHLSGSPPTPPPYRPLMHTHRTVAPRTATIEPNETRREGRLAPRRMGVVAGIASSMIVLALGACSPSASTVPVGSLSLPSVVLPSVDVSAAASAASQAALAALDQVDAAITANTGSSGLTTDDATSLTQLTAALRTTLVSGDMTAAKTAIDGLATKVDGLASKLTGPAGQQLKDAIAALKAAVPAS